MCYECGISFGIDIPILVVIPCCFVDDVWFVWCVVCQIKEERLFALVTSVDKGYCIFCGYVGIMPYVGVVLIVFDVDELVVVKSPEGVVIRVIGIRCADKPSIEFVKPSVERLNPSRCHLFTRHVR